MGKLISIFTTAAPVGVATRDLVTAFGAILAMLGVLGLLSQEQVDELTKQAPVVFTALGTLIYAAMTIYRSFAKSSSNKAAAAAKEIDAKIPKADPVVIERPGYVANIVVPPDGK